MTLKAFLLVMCVVYCLIPTHAFSQGDFPFVLPDLDSSKVKSLDASIMNGFEKGLITADSAAQLYSRFAQFYYDLGNFTVSARYLNKALNVLDHEQDRTAVARIYELQAEISMEQDDRVEALKRLHAARNIYEENQQNEDIMRVVRRIGNNYDYMGDHGIAMEYYEYCVGMARQYGDTELLAASLRNIGGIYSEEARYGEAIHLYREAISLADSMGSHDILYKIYQGMTIAFRDLERYDSAYSYLKRTLSSASNTGDIRAMGFAYQSHGFYFLATNRLDSAEYYMNKTMDLALQAGNAQLKTNALEGLEEIYRKSGRYKEALSTYKQYVAENDSLFNLRNSRLIQNIEERYRSEKNERELAEKHLMLQEAEYKYGKQQSLQTALYVVMALLILVLFLIYRSYKLRIKANELLKLKNEEIKTHMTEVEHVNEMKSRWFINVAHELRTPLTLIKGPVKRMLSTPALEPALKSDLLLVERNSSVLSNLVNEILDLSKLEGGEVVLNDTVFELGALISQTIAAFESRAEQLDIKLHFHRSGEILIRADREKLSKVLINLISNAIKFNKPSGSVEIDMEIDHTLNITVSDSGMGIKEKDQLYIFDRFYQSTNQEQLKGGTGIGLALAKEIVSMHQGTISVSSVYGKGTTFRIELPATMVHKPDDATSVAETKSTLTDENHIIIAKPLPNLSKKPKLLLVEDNADMRSYVSSLLDPHFQVVEAESGSQALLALSENHIEFIISDVMMPEMDGISFLKEVKKNPVWSHVPFIHLTALSDESLKKDMFQTGIDDFLHKPFDSEELIIRVKNLYENYLNRMAYDTYKAPKDSHDEKVIKKLRQEVLDFIDDSNFNILRLADAAAMSERQLYRFLKSATGLTPLQFIQEIKLSYAIELAQNRVVTNTSELAAAVGFRQASYFTSLFEKRFGKKPGVFLKP